MKKTMVAIILVFAISTLWSYNQAATPPQSPVLSPQKSGPSVSFHAHRQGRNAIELMWRFSANSNVVTLQIQRSYDSEFFNTIFSGPGNSGGWGRWKDENVFPGVIYYRLEATLFDGTVLYSPVEVVRIVQK
jgi:hypothetical protein